MIEICIIILIIAIIIMYPRRKSMPSISFPKNLLPEPARIWNDLEIIDNLDNGLAAHYKMNDNEANSTVVDSGPNSLDGDYQDSGGSINTSTGSEIGKINRSLSFDGTDEFVDCGINESIRNTLAGTGFTLSAWINQNGSSGYIAACTDGGGSQGWQIGLSGANLITAQFANSGGRYSWAITNSAIPTNEWVHVVVNYIGLTGAIEFYINGLPVSSTVLGGPTPSTTFDSTDSVTIGARNSGNSGFYTGDIDDVRIYARAITRKEIQAIYNLNFGTEGVSGQRKTTALQYRCNDNAANSDVVNTGYNPIAGTYRTFAAPVNTSLGSVPGKINTALDFDSVSNNVIDANQDLEEVFKDSFTIAFWINLVDGQSGSTQYFFNNQSAGDGVQFWVTGGGFLQFNYQAGSNQALSASASNVISNGATGWIHLLVIADAKVRGENGLKIYLNGERVSLGPTGNFGDTSGVTFGQYSNTTDFLIPNAYEGDFNGDIDDIRVIDKALSDEEVKFLFNFDDGTEYQTGIYDSLIGAWLNKAVANTAKDYSSQGNDLTINGDPVPLDIAGYDLDGTNDYFSRSVISTINKSSPWTIYGWFYFDDITNQQCLIENTQGASDALGIIFVSSSIRVGIWTGASYQYGASGTFTDQFKWIMLTATFNGIDTLKLYINDTLQVGTSTPFLALNVGLAICARTGGGNKFNGRIKDFRAYCEELDFSWISYQYSQGVPQ